MKFDELAGHNRPKALIERAIAADRLGHAQLLSGPDGIGKTLFARLLARTLLCRSEGERPCNVCPECLMEMNERHPDLIILEPQGDSRFISIKQIREMIEYLAFRPVQGARRVAIIREAEYMKEEGANALLKTLEEPAPFVTIVLTTARPRALLPTIRSRCQEIHFGSLTAEQTLNVLRDIEGLPAEDLELAARFSSGSPGKALEMIESGSLPVYREALKGFFGGEPFDTADVVLDWAKGGGATLEPQRQRIRQILHLLERTCRDLLLVRVGGAAGDMYHPHAYDWFVARAARLPVHRIQAAAEAVWDARRQIDANVSLELILRNLFEGIAALRAA